MYISLLLMSMPLFDSWKEIIGYYCSFISIVFFTQVGLSFLLLHCCRKNPINNKIRIIAIWLSKTSVYVRLVVFLLLSGFVLSPYLSFLSIALFLFGFILIILFLIGYIVLLSMERIREFLVGRKAFYFLLHFAIQLIIGCCIYVGIFKVRLWEMYFFPKDEEQFWLWEIYPELGILRRWCDDFIAILCLMAIPYMIFGIYTCVKYLVRRLKLLWH